MGLGGSTELYGFNNFPPEVSPGLDGDTYIVSCVGTLVISFVDTCIVSCIDVGFRERVATLVTSLVSMSIPPRQAQAPWHVIGGLHQLHHLLFSEPAALMDKVEAVVGLAVGTQGGLGDLALLYVDLGRVPADKALDVLQEEDLVDDHIKGGDDLLGVGNKLLVQVLIELLNVDAVDGQEGLFHWAIFSSCWR